MLKPRSPQESFFLTGRYLYDRIVPQDHLLRKINQVVDFSFVHDLVRDRYTPDFGPGFAWPEVHRPAAGHWLPPETGPTPGSGTSPPTEPPARRQPLL